MHSDDIGQDPHPYLNIWIVSFLSFAFLLTITFAGVLCGFCILCERLFRKDNEKDKTKNTILDNTDYGAVGSSLPDIKIIAVQTNSKPPSELSQAISSASTAIQKDEKPEDVGVDHQLGKIHFKVIYRPRKKELIVEIMEGGALKENSNSLVRVFVLPEMLNYLSTTIQRGSAPDWHETLVFEDFPIDDLLNHVLAFQVLSSTQTTTTTDEELIGEIGFLLRSIYRKESTGGTGMDIWRNIQPCERRRGYFGEIQLSLCYDRKASLLTVTVVKARDLDAQSVKKESTIVCKICVVDSRGRALPSKQTAAQLRTSHPHWSESMAFNVDPENIEKSRLDIAVVAKYKMVQTKVFGQIKVGLGQNSEGIKHWYLMLMRNAQHVGQWHTLW